MTTSKKFVAVLCITLISLVAMGCSEDSNPLTSVDPDPDPIDTAPPAVPANVNVADDGTTATVSWAANTTDADLAGFVVSRDYYGDVEVLVATPAMITSYQDADARMGISVYQISSVDESGNQSAVSSITLVRTSNHQTHDLNDLSQ